MKLTTLLSVPLCSLFLIACSESPNTASTPAHSKPEAAPTASSSSDQKVSASIHTDSDNGQNTLLWGDTHSHTSNSFDVYLFGNTDATPDKALRFAKGEKIISPTTQKPMQLQVPLDFVVISDHSEAMGAITQTYLGNTNFTETKTGKAILEIAPNQSEENMTKAYGLIAQAGSNLENPYNLTPQDIYNDIHGGDKRVGIWQEYLDTVEKHNVPGEFTTLIGWEWSSQPKGGNMHRVVFMAEGKTVAEKFLPYSSLESQDPEDLWAWLEKTSAETGATFVAIPHNPNLSIGQMFPETTQSGEAITASYANTRNKWEKAVEITQIKGDSETHPLFSPEDPFADFETYQFVLIPGGGEPKPTEADYVRSGLKRGLELMAKTGANPFKVGVIGSTDTHTGMSAYEETNFGGKGQHDRAAEVRMNPTGIGDSKGWDMGAAGIAGVWAKSNSREDIVAAFQRREVYASSGPRIALRFFGGYNFTSSDAEHHELATIGYDKGVSMGSDLPPSTSAAPNFLIAAVKDPNAANLDRIQVVKGWLDDDGNSQEKVFDVALSDNRTANQPVGNTVDINTGNYTNTIGSNELTAVWTDPEFDPAQHAFYYARVLEIPTPRYSLFDAIALGIDPTETNKPLTIQERVYSSPIWYNGQQ